jgi:hypothetical protein
VVIKTKGKEKTATERCIPPKNGMSFIPKVLAAKMEEM